MNHPNVHAAWSPWSEQQTLHVIAPYINPFRYRRRRELFHDFRRHMEASANVALYVVEVAFGDRPFEVTSRDNPADLQLRNRQALWLKENAINLAVQRLPAGWKYAAYVDGDFHFTRHDWALEAIHQLQHFDWVQLYSGYAMLDGAHRPMQQRPSFAYAYHQYFGGKPSVHRERVSAPGTALAAYDASLAAGRQALRNTTPGATGGAWAFTQDSFNAVGGLLDTCVLGAGDWYMAFGLVGNTTDGHPEALSCGPAYEASIRRWQERAFAAVQGRVGYVDNYATHGWHGDHRNRGYGERWKILRDHAFDPAVDLTRDWQGLLGWRGNKPEMEADVNRYFLSRNEDSTESSTPALY